MKTFLLTLTLFLSLNLFGQQPYYFPPAGNTTWQTVDPLSLGWCQKRIDTLDNYLQLKNSKGFIILKNGKIAMERYYGTFTKDSLWYWASAGKSLTAFLTGIAQEEGYLSIEDSTSKYLGIGWTSEPAPKEGLIKVRHQLEMTTGIEPYLDDLECTDDTCLQYLADAGTRWFYNTAPYRLINDVIAQASGINYNQYTNSRVKNPTGMSSGTWVQDVFYSRPRDAARFGLLMLNHGIWNTDTLMHDTNYYNAMINTSQAFNESYGYLWWLNGKSSAMLPGSSIVFPGEIIPNAPNDLYAALGKNDQKIYVVPSMDMVVVRMGNTAGLSLFAVSNFDNELWARIMNLDCNVGVEETNVLGVKIYPNPAQNTVTITLPENAIKTTVEILTTQGQLVKNYTVGGGNQQLDISGLANGIYLLDINTDNHNVKQRLVIIN